jgi:ArsR family transcriptional regulator
MTNAQHATIFKAFCDETRLNILARLRGGEVCVCALSESLGIKQSALSYHMKILVRSGIVSARQEGKWTHYSLSETGIETARELLAQITTPNSEQAPVLCCDK